MMDIDERITTPPGITHSSSCLLLFFVFVFFFKRQQMKTNWNSNELTFRFCFLWALSINSTRTKEANSRCVCVCVWLGRQRAVIGTTSYALSAQNRQSHGGRRISFVLISTNFVCVQSVLMDTGWTFQKFEFHLHFSSRFTLATTNEFSHSQNWMAWRVVQYAAVLTHKQ